MRVGYVSDLHYDFNSKFYSLSDLIRETIEVIKSRGITHLIINGDITSDYRQTMDIVERLKEGAGIEVSYVPGNHDVYSLKRDSEEAYKAIEEDENSILNKVKDIGNGWVIVGGFSWYDYTLETLGKSEYDYNRNRGEYWVDSWYVNWNRENRYRLVDVEYCKEQMETLEEVIKLVSGDKKIMLINHFVPRREFVEHKKDDFQWCIGNAFMGTDKLQGLVDRYKNIEKIAFGHTHKRYGEVDIGTVNYISRPLGYYGEWENKTFKEELDKVLMVVDLQ